MKPRDLKPHERIIVALDVSDIRKARKLVEELSPHIWVFKIGFEAVYSSMADLLLISSPTEAMMRLFDIRDLAMAITPKKAFFDVKLNDIPNTVEKAVQAIARLSPKMFNIHASAGKKAISAAAAKKGNSLLFGVTVLTSMDEEECVSIFGATPNSKVLQFTTMLVNEGADGIICAPKEGRFLRNVSCYDKLIIATPNVRPLWAGGKDDQNKERQMTPAEAVKAGIDMLVIGRPITNPPAQIGGPVEAAKAIAEEIALALGKSNQEVFSMGPNGIRRNT